MLVFVSSGAVLANTVSGGALGGVGTALAVGFVSCLLVASLGLRGGVHLNPAVTIAYWARRKLSTPGAVAFIIAQLVGAVVGAWFLTKIYQDAASIAHLGVPGTAIFVGKKAALLTEAILTALLVLAAFGVEDKRTSSPALLAIAIGFAYAVGALIGGPPTGGIMNPARFFGPAAVAGYWVSHWLYWAGPVAGGLVSAYWYRIMAGSDEQP